MSSNPKGDHSSTYRVSRPRKRSFHGNQHSNKGTSFIENKSASAKKLQSATSENVIVKKKKDCYMVLESQIKRRALLLAECGEDAPGMARREEKRGDEGDADVCSA
ncbi:hypothetical protein EAG_01932 [Camponotus floridanus]|uniref:Uncharacterized protein n=1 Tax=Camponotus floridanus TaxID=104421 RepID=E1ZVN6_CAMFO|nr:hypothetical protein EAG_01932 [Camponotus floridanus]